MVNVPRPRAGRLRGAVPPRAETFAAKCVEVPTGCVDRRVPRTAHRASDRARRSRPRLPGRSLRRAAGRRSASELTFEYRRLTAARQLTACRPADAIAAPRCVRPSACRSANAGRHVARSGRSLLPAPSVRWPAGEPAYPATPAPTALDARSTPTSARPADRRQRRRLADAHRDRADLRPARSGRRSATAPRRCRSTTTCASWT